jgi:hypothetical protein
MIPLSYMPVLDVSFSQLLTCSQLVGTVDRCKNETIILVSKLGYIFKYFGQAIGFVHLFHMNAIKSHLYAVTILENSCFEIFPYSNGGYCFNSGSSQY